MRFFDYHRSSASYRVRIALAMKGLAPERIDISLAANAHQSPDYRARNAQGFVPALELDDGRVLTQSLAILQWLDDAYPDPPLLPADRFDRAAALADALVIAADIHPLGNLRVLRHIEAEFGVDQAGKDAWYQRWVHDGFAALEARAGDGPFYGGAAPGIVDICLVPQMFNARRFHTDLGAYPRLVAFDAAACALPAFRAAHPSAVDPG